MADIVSRFFADPTVSAIITASLAGLVSLWLLSALWAHGDAERRTGSGAAALVTAGWVLLSTPLMLPLSLAAYVLVRPAESNAERRVREITASMIADSLVPETCHTCGSIVESEWRRCPTCTAWLAAPCSDCGRWAEVGLEICPWCGERDRDRPVVAEPAPALVAAAAGTPGGAGLRSRTPALSRVTSQRGTPSRQPAEDAHGVQPLRRARSSTRRAPGVSARSFGRATGGRAAAGTRS